MNLMERNNHTQEEDWREDLRSGLKNDTKGTDETDDLIDLPVEDLDQAGEDDEMQESAHGLQGLLQRPYMTSILLGVIVLLLVCIIVLLLLMPNRRGAAQTGTDLQQNITEYAEEQKRNDYVSGMSGETVSIEPEKDAVEDADVSEEPEEETKPEEEPEEPEKEEEIEPVSADSDKTAIVVDVEDENDVSYTKEYILDEALPYFADNNQDAIWDLAHLKRYVKLSAQLENTNQYYYNGDVDSDGKPHGKGLAIYENNSYYYGDWVNGIRSGEGTWFRFYIGKKNKTNAMGKYIAHSYSGLWADDLPNGQGAEHYDVDISKLKVRERILQNVVGNFTGGLYDGDMYANTVDYTGNVEEWSGIVSKGVFTLWRDMSAIGECSVWRKNDDHSLCMDIDKSENKNQGIRELLKLE